MIAFVAATAAFWIIFRVLTFWPCVDALRIGSALLMGVAVCGTHYTGMFAAHYQYEQNIDHSGGVVDGRIAFRIASIGSLVLCFWMVSLVVVRDLRVGITRSRTTQERGHNGGTSAGSGASTPSGRDEVVPFNSGHLPRNIVHPASASASGRLSPVRPGVRTIDRAYDVVPGAAVSPSY